MAPVLPHVEEFRFEGQRSTSILGYQNAHAYAFPLALNIDVDWRPTVDQAADHIRALSTSGALFEAVQQHGGALLTRGLPIQSADNYSFIAPAFDFEAHEEVGRPPVRTVLAKHVKTANEGLPELPIWPHNEYGWSTHNPAWLTRATSSRLLLAAAHEGRKHVDAEDDESTIRVKIESGVRRHSDYFEWHDDGSLSVTHVVPIIRKHLATGLTTWFGNLTSACGRSRHHGATKPPFCGNDGSYHPLPTYGDGSPIETADLEPALSIAEDMQVDMIWQKGDVVLLDNYAVMHSRRAWAGRRTVLAALWDEKGRGGLVI